MKTHMHIKVFLTLKKILNLLNKNNLNLTVVKKYEKIIRIQIVH